LPCSMPTIGTIKRSGPSTRRIRHTWVLPWAILPEVDYLLAAHVGAQAEEAFLADLASGLYGVEWGDEGDLVRARQLCTRYRSLRLGLVDGWWSRLPNGWARRPSRHST
jgi:hypothetical protein